MEKAQCYMVCWCGGQTLRDGESSVLYGLLVWMTNTERWRELSVIWFVGVEDKH